MTTLPELAVPSSDKLIEAIHDHTKVTERELSTARAEIASLNRQLDAAMAEAGILREQLSAKTKAFDAIQSYATRLDTKLELIVDVIGGVKAEAMKFGARQFDGIISDDTREITSDGRSISDIISRLPRNDMRN